MKRLAVLVAVALALVASEARADIIDTLPVGYWIEIPNTAINDYKPVPYDTDAEGGCGFSCYLNLWVSGAFDTNRHRLMISGGGHADYGGNEIYCFDVDDLTMSLCSPGSHPTGSIPPYTANPGTTYPDGKPSSRHMYDDISYIPSQDKFFFFGGSMWGQGGNGGNDSWWWNPGTNVWTQRANMPWSDPLSSVSAYDPVNDRVYIAGINSSTPLSAYNPTNNTWTEVGSGSPGSWCPQDGSVAAIDEDNHLFITSKGYNNETSFVYDLNQANPVQVRKTIGGNQEMETATSWPGFVWDPVSHHLIAWKGGKQVYSLNTGSGTGSAWTWTRIDANPASPTPPDPPSHGTAGRFIYSTTRNCFFVVTGNSVFTNSVWAYRLAGAPGPDPDPPTVSITTPTNGNTVSGSIAVDATANDNVGVIGVQFKLDGANLQSEDTTNPYGITWNTTTATNGSHALTAVARDLAGNSTTSATVNVTVNNAAPPPVGTLVQDGPDTPEQISMLLPITGTLAAQFATVRWRPTASGTWIVGHPLFRIHPEWNSTDALPANGGLGLPENAFAGVITGLTPGTNYTVEITTDLDTGPDNVQTLVVSTRTLPLAAGAATITIAAGSTQSQIQTALNNAVAGSVVQFQDGTYNISTTLGLNRAGTSGQPIYVRGTTRAGTIIHMTTDDQIIGFNDTDDLVLENMTLTGDGVDHGLSSSSMAFIFSDSYVQDRITIRQVTATGIDLGVWADNQMTALLIYDCTFTGNNLWNDCYLTDNQPAPCGHNIAWNDDGIRLPGFGNCAFNNTLSGFGDAFSVDNGVKPAAIHIYRNDVLFTDDDAFESDVTYRNNTFYDNRIENCMSALSCDPLNGGPLYFFRNFIANIGRSPFKLNNDNSGEFIYNNTMLKTTGQSPHNNWGEIQFNNGTQKGWGYRNNILIWRGSGHIWGMECDELQPLDFDHNAWYPDEQFWWSNDGGSFSSLADAKANIPTSVPVFSGITKRHTNDTLTVFDPFATDITLGSDYLTKVTVAYTPILSGGTTPKNTGAIIPGITDGFSGAAPDRGAIIEGLAAFTYGDRGAPGPPGDTVAPSPPHTVRLR